jgi:hypothetical protein
MMDKFGLSISEVGGHTSHLQFYAPMRLGYSVRSFSSALSVFSA